MEKMLCPSCGAPIIPTVTQAFLTCEYCGSSVANPHYSEAAAAEAARSAKPDTKAICVKTLIEMGQSENLDSVDPDCFGNPIYQGDSARSALSIPDDEQLYFLYAHSILLLGFSEGIALTDGGLYYSCGGEKGSRSWDAFITGAISCADRVNKQDGTLRIGSSITISVDSDRDSRLARFLVDFHNHAYHLCTGEAAPASWTVTEPRVTADAADDDPSLLGTILPAVGALLGGSSLLRSTGGSRTVTMHPAGRPTIFQDRREQAQPPRPLHTQPHHRPAQPVRHKPAHPAPNGRPIPRTPARPGLGLSTRPAPGRPGTQRSPGMNRPGPQRGPGKPGGRR